MGYWSYGLPTPPTAGAKAPTFMGSSPYGTSFSNPPTPAPGGSPLPAGSPPAGGAPRSPGLSSQNPTGWDGSGVDWSALQASSPELYQALSGLVGRPGFGRTAGMVFLNLARAATAKPLYSENDIRNAALAPQNQGAMEAWNAARNWGWQAAMGGMTNTGGYNDTLQRQAAQIAADADQRALQQVQGLTSENQQYLQNVYQQALSGAQDWADIHRQNRMNQAQLQAALTALQGMSRTSSLGALGSLLGSVGGMLMMKK